MPNQRKELEYLQALEAHGIFFSVAFIKVFGWLPKVLLALVHAKEGPQFSHSKAEIYTAQPSRAAFGMASGVIFRWGKCCLALGLLLVKFTGSDYGSTPLLQQHLYKMAFRLRPHHIFNPA